MAGNDHVGIGKLVGYYAAAAGWHVGENLYGRGEQGVFIGIGVFPVTHRCCGRRRESASGGRIVVLGNIAIPETGMHQVQLQQLDRETAVFNLFVGLGQLVVGPTDIQEQAQYSGKNQQTDGDRDHQFNEAETLLVGARFGGHAHGSRLPMRTRVVTVRRHRSLAQAAVSL